MGLRGLLLAWLSMAVGCGSEQGSASGSAMPAPVLCDRNLGPVDSGIPSETGPIVQCVAVGSNSTHVMAVPRCLPGADADGGMFWQCCVQLHDPPDSFIVLTECP
jgi:hypothetical protein